MIVLRNLNEVLREEKKPFARIVDDEAAQLLAVAQLRLSMAATDLPFGCSHCFGEIKTFLEQIQVQLPPAMLHDPDFMCALGVLAESTLKGTEIQFTIGGAIDGGLPEALQSAILRIAEEALTNVVRHAYAQRVSIQVEIVEGAELQCSISDDGVGFDPERVLSGRSGHGVGLLGIRERVKLLDGTFSVVSSRGAGAELVFKVPFAGDRSQRADAILG